ncbi:MAG: hypothetical protein ABIK89_04145 [Planctomycetota bacterium]
MDDPAQLLARLAREFTETLRRRESPDVEEYARQHPELAERIREVLGTLRLMAEPPPRSPWPVPFRTLRKRRLRVLAITICWSGLPPAAWASSIGPGRKASTGSSP